MIRDLIFWSIALMAFFIACIIIYVSYIALCLLWDRELRPSLRNLQFAIFGKSKSEDLSYYELWSKMGRRQYRHFTRGFGNRHFARFALKRLLWEARNESRKNTTNKDKSEENCS